MCTNIHTLKVWKTYRHYHKIVKCVGKNHPKCEIYCIIQTKHENRNVYIKIEIHWHINHNESNTPQNSPNISSFFQEYGYTMWKQYIAHVHTYTGIYNITFLYKFTKIYQIRSKIHKIYDPSSNTYALSFKSTPIRCEKHIYAHIFTLITIANIHANLHAKTHILRLAK